MGSHSLLLYYRPLTDFWRGEATDFSCENDGDHTDGPGQAQRGTDNTKRHDLGKRLAGEEQEIEKHSRELQNLKVQCLNHSAKEKTSFKKYI